MAVGRNMKCLTYLAKVFGSVTFFFCVANIYFQCVFLNRDSKCELDPFWLNIGSYFLDVLRPYDHCLPVGWLVSWSVYHNFLKRQGSYTSMLLLEHFIL